MSAADNTNPNYPEKLLVDSIRAGDTNAWQQLIDRFEGRLLAFVGSRLLDRSHAEDIVQETFVGFLNSLPNFDCQRPLESYLFSIAAYKLTDHLRREGRRHTLAFHVGDDSSDGAQQVPAPVSSCQQYGSFRGASRHRRDRHGRSPPRSNRQMAIQIGLAKAQVHGAVVCGREQQQGNRRVYLASPNSKLPTTNPISY